MSLNSTLLISLADKYEIPSFCDADPSQFLRWYPLSQTADVECCSFIAAMLAFGNRKQFIPKIQSIMEMADKTSGSITKWLLAGSSNFPCGEKKFYRFYSYDDMRCLFNELTEILKEAGSLGESLKGKAFPCLQPGTQSSATPSSGDTPQRPNLAQILSDSFPKSAIVPKGKTSANKRIHMFLRWMVRQNSPVDLGLWNWYPKSELLIPLDIHVMQEGIKLGLLPENATATKKTAIMLTQQMNKVFPGDPARADFALFGLGVDEN